MSGRIRLSVPWRFHNPVEVAVGRGCRQGLVDRVKDMAVLVVTTERGRQQLLDDRVLCGLTRKNAIIWIDTVTQNPDLSYLQSQIDAIGSAECDAVLAFGGGSAMDAAKVINVAMAPQCEGTPLRRLIEEPTSHLGATTTPLYTVSTTAGTGSEVTPFATVWDHASRRKMSLAGAAVWPTAAFTDAELTDTVPVPATISTGLDAINQAFESIWNRNANPITLGYATRALELGMPALPRLAKGVSSKGDRDAMAEASLMAGLAISHTRTALCHSMSYPLTAHFGVPHGLACAFTMPAVLRTNVMADDGRFTDLAAVITGQADTDGLVAQVEQLNAALDVVARVKALVPDIGSLLALQGEMVTPGRADNNLAANVDIEAIIHDSW